MRVLTIAFISLVASLPAFAQQQDSLQHVHHVSGNVSITQNGISLIPTFSLGKPATIINLSVGNERLTIDPDIRFSLTAQPWTILFWARYRVKNSGRFRLSVGAHPGLNFKESTVLINNDSFHTTITRRFLAAEFSPRLLLGNHITIGTYHLYSHGFDKGTAANNYFATVNASFSDLMFGAGFTASLSPQFYYLAQDERSGFYFNIGASLQHKKSPFYFSGLINRKISGNILAPKDFIWNISLNYAFQRNYVRRN